VAEWEKMKQMSLIEMDGFLKGKCIPRDLKVNETNAEYLVRKFAEAEAKCAALAAEVEAVKSAHQDAVNTIMYTANRTGVLYTEKAIQMSCKTPATDAFLTEVRAKAFDDLCAAFVKHASVSGLDDGDCVTVKEATDALLHCAEQLHKGVHS
jgi:isochorismate hydrolase